MLTIDVLLTEGRFVLYGARAFSHLGIMSKYVLDVDDPPEEERA